QSSPKADIFLGSSPQAINRNQAVAQVENQQFVILSGIDTSRRFSVEVVLADGTILSQTERILPLKSVPNFRDIGGYRTRDGDVIRWNRVYRSSSLANLSVDDSKQI